MDLATANELISPRGERALHQAAAETDPDSLAAGTRLRKEFGPHLAAAALHQVALRRKARGKLGPLADDWLLTDVGLEQATRPSVARWRAARFAAVMAEEEGSGRAGAVESAGAGSRITGGEIATLVDLGCGLGVDSYFAAAAGLAINPVERDPVTAIFAQANLGVPVTTADAETQPIPPGAAVFADPSRRNQRGRSWDTADLSPSWDFITNLEAATLNVKLGPGFPARTLPETAEAIWIGDGPDAVELSLWFGRGARPGRRAARLTHADTELESTQTQPAVAEPETYLYEPHPAAIAAGLTDTISGQHRLHRLHPRIAYLTGDTGIHSPWLTAFRITDTLRSDEKTLKAWVRRANIGTLEIKKRGVDLDPAQLRRRLRPRGDNPATLIITPTPTGTLALVAERVAPNESHRAYA